MSDGCKTWFYYRAPHGKFHRRVGGRRIVVTEKSAAQIPTLTKIDAMFMCLYRWRMRDCGHFVVCTLCKNAIQCPRGGARAPSLAQRYLGGPFKALSWKHSHQSAVEGPLLKERRGSDVRQRQASLLVYIYIYNIIYI